MKNLFIFIIFIIVFVLIFIRSASAQSVEDIIDQYLIARGGLDKLQSVQSIELEGVRHMMNGEVKVKITKVQGKLFRSDFSFEEMEGYTIITPLGGWASVPTEPGKVQQLPWNTVAPALQELDIAGSLVNYKSKGYAAVLLGKETIDDKPCYKIQLTAADGKESLYFIDTKTDLMAQSRHKTESNAGNQPNGILEIVTNFSDYKDFDGVLFPQTIGTEATGMGAGLTTFDKIEMNITVDEKLYKPGN